MAPCPRPTLLWHPARWVPALESSPAPQVCCWAVPAPARRLRECLGRECLHRVIPGHGQRSAAPRGTEGILVLLHLWVDFRPGLKEQDFCYFVSGKTSCNVSPVS